MTNNFAGLSSTEVALSREKHGDNSLVKEKSKSFLKKFLENLGDPIIKILILALVVEVVFTFGHCNLFEVFGILAAILIATTVSTASEFGSEMAFKKMQQDSMDSTVKVLRDGIISEIPSNELVIGDIVYLFAGEKIQADGIILSGSLKVDQSALNGESRDVTKRAADDKGWDLSSKNKVFRGSVIVSGEAVMRVARVGSSTYYGMVAKDVQTETRESPLKLRLAKFASQISKIGYVMAFVVAITYLFNTFVADNGFIPQKVLASIKNLPFLFSSLIHALTLMITVIVVAAPEGLPMMITVVLSANMKKMMKDGVFVKKLVGIETAGSMNILFTDKTGTLTTGKLECDKIFTASQSYKGLVGLKKNKTLYNYLTVNALCNTDSAVSGGRVIGGNATDRAIAEYFKNEKMPNVTLREKIPFSSEKKYSKIILSDGTELVKGAPEIIISQSIHAISENGEITEFSKNEIESEYKNQAGAGNRVIGVGMRCRGVEGLVFLALIILKDKVRRGVAASVKGVKRAGVQVVMLTGDGRETASAIARECGITTGSDDEMILTSSELSNMKDEEIKKILPRIRVLARALPQDKTRLVRLSQEMDLVVGMTGDGINDAPSLKLADVGFAMGNGADIAKGAGDVILLDNSFFSINRTILYGRTIFKSIRKFVTFQLIMNISACGVSLLGQFFGIDSPITIIQMLWVNIIMDTLGGLAFAGEPPIEYYMKEPPKHRREPILSSDMLSQIVFTGAYTLGLCILFLRSEFIHSYFRYSEGNVCFMTAFYALFIFAGIFNCFGARCERMWLLSNITKNKPFVFIMLLISVLQIFMIYYGGSVFRTVPLLPSELLCVLLLAFTVVPFEFLRRIFFKLRPIGNRNS